MAGNGAVREVTFHVRKFDPTRDSVPYIQQFTVPVKLGMTVLDGLHYIKEHHDQTLAWRYSCRMGVCGSCGMLINGRPTLACNTQILDVATSNLSIGPLPNFAIVRDLAPDLSSMIEKHLSISPFIIRAEAELNDPAGEYYQSPHQLEEFLQFAFCIKCGCCMGACPTLATDLRYLGPMPLGQAYRYNADNRDDGMQQRIPVVGGKTGVVRCHYAGECSRACPKGVDPARAVQLLKKQLVASYFGMLAKQPSQKQGPNTKGKRLPDIPDAPPRTVKA
jgi:succinate dehydrogenase / fumarate reductase iron-sulfur subunit